MPTRAPRPCAHAGCRALNVPGSSYCGEHQAEAIERKRARDADRPTARQRGYGRKWEKAAAGYLRKHPLCARCLAEGRTEQAELVDHIVPHRGDMKLFWDRSNWQALSKRCHDRKTATEDSAFARPGRRGPRG